MLKDKEKGERRKEQGDGEIGRREQKEKKEKVKGKSEDAEPEVSTPAKK